MLTAIVTWAAIGIAALAQVGPTPTPAAGDTPACPETRSLADDISLVIDHFAPVFLRDLWKLSIADDWNNGTMTFIWLPVSGASSIASAIVVMWPCGVTSEQLDDYYSDDALDVIVSAYDTATLTARCTVDNVRIYDFDLERDDGSFAARFWIEIAAPTRVVQANLTVPAGEEVFLDDYGRILYPNSINCDKR